ncbi:VanW family protein [Corynebacterium breve]|uniref:VanW family protein n=1 Tax=Corynebacterium breve TaxID=3049799 RepID=A0ABY8VJV9_9CORY|nr:VanW family protein [Corynebacterium breve]WIM69070.1 VanW family protein [Corynebacterium breve]
MNRDAVPRGTTVGGIEIGGMKHDEAVRTLEEQLGDEAGAPVTVTAGELTSDIVPAQAGLGIDWEATVAAAGEESMNPISRLRGLFSSKEVDVVPTVDEAALAPELDRVVGELSTDPVDGSVALEAGDVKITDPVLGQTVNRDELNTRVSTGWLNPSGVTVEPEEVQPAITEDKLKEVADGPAAKAISGPLKVEGRDDVVAEIPVERIGEFVTFNNVEGNIETVVNPEGAQAIFDEGLASTEVEMKNASYNSDGSVNPSADGSAVDWEKTMADFEGRVIGEGERTWEAAYEDVAATFTTEMAESATYDQVVGEFTTKGYSEASGKNIAIVAGMVNGAVVGPGETFSLNGHTGPRGTAQGFVESGIIIDGRAGEAVGGGISQFATTLYNAAYFAGMTDVAHTPHSYYISRYPAGREATVYEGAIDLKFKNDSNRPVRIDASAGGGSVTVRLMGVKTVEVESVNGGRWDETEPDEREMTGDKCIPSSGNPGFTTSDTRIIRDLNGKEISRETQTTVYDPQPIVTCS